MTTLQTIGDVRNMIRRCRAVYIRPFFGTLERWVKISKSEALAMFAAYEYHHTLIDAVDYDHTLSLDAEGDLFLG